MASPVSRAGSSLGSAQNLAHKPRVFKSLARLGSIFGKLEEARCNIFLARRLEPLLGHNIIPINAFPFSIKR